MTWGKMIWGVDPWGVEIVDQLNAGDGWLINDGGAYESTREGTLRREPTVATRCRTRLRVQRGRWIFDETLGSRLYTIETTKNADRLVNDYIREALQPLIDDGSIVSIAVGAVQVDDVSGAMAVKVDVTVPGNDVITVGTIPLGAS